MGIPKAATLLAKHTALPHTHTHAHLKMSKTMQATVVQSNKTTKVEQKPIPGNLKGKEVLFKVVAVGQNPTDWKHVAFLSEPGTISGCDFVGVATELGPDVPQETKGQLRAGFVRGGMSKENGSFAEYVKQEYDVCFEVPDNVSPQQAASGPIPISTAAQALFLRLGLPKPADGPDASFKDKWILIWSGSTAVGQYAIQLAKLIGLKIATTASPKKHELVKSLGADVVVDYKDPEVSKKLREATNDGIVYGLDCIAEKPSYQLAQEAFSSKGGHLICLLFDLPDQPRKDVKTEATLAYTANGQDNSFGPAEFKTSPEDRQNQVDSMKLTTKLFKEGKLKPIDVTDVGGLDTIQKGLDMLKNGENPTKLVHTISSYP